MDVFRETKDDMKTHRKNKQFKKKDILEILDMKTKHVACEINKFDKY